MKKWAVGKTRADADFFRMQNLSGGAWFGATRVL